MKKVVQKVTEKNKAKSCGFPSQQDPNLFIGNSIPNEELRRSRESHFGPH